MVVEIVHPEAIKASDLETKGFSNEISVLSSGLERIKIETKAEDTNSGTKERFVDFAQDPWIELEPSPKASSHDPLATSNHTKILIIGAGYGGLLFAVRLLQSGILLEDILLVDAANGFGGTWYWNRYPGLRCDIESYIYMPLLEETGHVPSRKYVSGEELRQYAGAIARQWQLDSRTLFNTTIKSLKWDDKMLDWTGHGITRTLDQEAVKPFVLSSEFVIVATGSLSKPKIPDLTGMKDFQGHIFHTARWNYEVTGGSPQAPHLEKLKNKRVGIIGTGATAVQVIPELAKWSKEVYVFQRTPSEVGIEPNPATDREWWVKHIQEKGHGWQRRRAENFNSFLSNPIPRTEEEDLVNDGWTRFRSYAATIGGESNVDPNFLTVIKEMDKSRQDALRKRICDAVHEKTIAKALIPVHLGWCKRPCFHDEYFQSYNCPNVRLVATQGQGVTGLTRRGVLHGDTEIELDLIVLATGYDSSNLCPSFRANLEVIGQEGRSMQQKWSNGVATLHGVVTRGFPNFFFSGISQAGITANQVYMFEQAAIHVAYIIQSALGRVGPSDRIAVQPTHEAEEIWATRTVISSQAFAAAGDCGRGSYTLSSRHGRTEAEREQLARQSPWGAGMAQYVKILEQWRATSDLDGVEFIRRLKS
jgi:cation diffusion facilitator CzcD-associated flavoprotein CzcO